MAAVSAERKPGRPRGPGRINATVRFSPDQYAALRDSAERQGRSVSEEVETRIQQSFSDEEVRETVERGLDRLNATIDQEKELLSKIIAKYQARAEKLQQQIIETKEEHLRSLTDSTALAQRLFQRIADLQKERALDLQKERALDEERLVQMVEDAVARALRR
jgi:hypothetical protein